VLQGFQAADHSFDARADLLVLLEERGPLAGQRLVSLAQRAILFLQMFHGRDQFFDALCESHQLEIELCFCGVAHVWDYSEARATVQINVGRLQA